MKKTLKIISGLAALGAVIGTALAQIRPDTGVLVLGISAIVSKVADFADDGKLNNSLADEIPSQPVQKTVARRPHIRD